MPGERANAWRNPLAAAPMMGASYLDDLAAQVAEKRRAQESEKLRDRAANLQHMGAAPFTGGPIAGGPANGFLAEQGARVERAQAELGDAPRPRGGAQQHGIDIIKCVLHLLDRQHLRSAWSLVRLTSHAS